MKYCNIIADQMMQCNLSTGFGMKLAQSPQPQCISLAQDSTEGKKPPKQTSTVK